MKKRLTDIKHRLRQVHTSAKAPNPLGNDLVRLRLARGCGLVVQLLDPVLPRCADVGFLAVVGRVVDQEADVVVAGLVGVVFEELRSQRVSYVSRTRAVEQGMPYGLQRQDLPA